MPAIPLAEDYVRRKSSSKRPFSRLYLAACLHVSKETAVFLRSLDSLGMEISLVAANPLSSQNEIASYLSSQGIEVRARKNELTAEYLKEIRKIASSDPDLIIDDGGELHVAYARSNSNSCFGGTDETTSGTVRLFALEKNKKLRYPVIPVNEARIKHFFDNKYGTGQSALDGLVRATGLLIAGKILVVAGYGWVGKGVAMRSRGLGARVIVTEVDPIRALEAHLDGFEVMPMNLAVRKGEIFLTCTGQIEIIASRHFSKMKDGAILGNCGHFDKEIDVAAIKKLSTRRRRIRENVDEYLLDKKSVYLLCEGRVVNLVAAEGHPPEVMQLSFATQLLSLNYLVFHREELKKSRERVLQVPREIEDSVSRFALSSFKLKLDRLSRKQERYHHSFIR